MGLCWSKSQAGIDQQSQSQSQQPQPQPQPPPQPQPKRARTSDGVWGCSAASLTRAWRAGGYSDGKEDCPLALVLAGVQSGATTSTVEYDTEYVDPTLLTSIAQPSTLAFVSREQLALEAVFFLLGRHELHRLLGHQYEPTNGSKAALDTVLLGILLQVANQEPTIITTHRFALIDLCNYGATTADHESVHGRVVGGVMESTAFSVGTVLPNVTVVNDTSARTLDKEEASGIEDALLTFSMDDDTVNNNVDDDNNNTTTTTTNNDDNTNDSVDDNNNNNNNNTNDDGDAPPHDNQHEHIPGTFDTNAATATPYSSELLRTRSGSYLDTVNRVDLLPATSPSTTTNTTSNTTKTATPTATPATTNTTTTATITPTTTTSTTATPTTTTTTTATPIVTAATNNATNNATTTTTRVNATSPTMELVANILRCVYKSSSAHALAVAHAVTTVFLAQEVRVWMNTEPGETREVKPFTDLARLAHLEAPLSPLLSHIDVEKLYQDVRQQLAIELKREPKFSKENHETTEEGVFKFEPYQYGSTALKLAFSNHIKLMCRATMCAWECTNTEKWPSSSKLQSSKQQFLTMETCHRISSQVKDLNKKREASKDDDTRKTLLLQIQKLNRKVAAKVNNCTEDVFLTLTNRGLFTETKKFSARAKARNMPQLEIYQAGRNAWTCYALQVIYGSKPANLSHAVFGYSLLYPYTDNFLDDPNVDLKTKLDFQYAFGRRLLGEHTDEDTPQWENGKNAFEMAGLIEKDWDREKLPEAFFSLLAINDAQTWSLYQQQLLSGEEAMAQQYTRLLEQSVYKGGTSVLADAHMVNGAIPIRQSAFAFALGFALQIVDDVQDTEEDTESGHNTLFTRSDDLGDRKYNEGNTRRLANFLHFVCHSASGNSSGAPIDEGLRGLVLSMTYNMVLKAIARNPEIFSPDFKQDWARQGPLPPDKMAKLQSMQALHKLALNDMI